MSRSLLELFRTPSNKQKSYHNKVWGIYLFFVKLYQEKALQITFIICQVWLLDLPWPDVFVIGDLIIDVEL